MTDLQLATAAHSGTSFVPEQRGRMYVADLAAQIEAGRAWIAEQIPGERGAELADEYEAGYRRRWRAWMGAKGRCISTMITGGSNFPVRRAEKANASEHRRSEELRDWSARFRRRVAREAARAARPADPAAAARAEADELRRRLDLYKQCNAIIRRKVPTAQKVAAIVALGMSEATATRIATEPDCFGGLGFPSYELNSLRGKIKRAEQRAATYRASEARAEVAPVEGDGWRILEHVCDERLRIEFDEKPSEPVRAILKRHGFRWSPRAGAWQRQLTENARAAARSVLEQARAAV